MDLYIHSLKRLLVPVLRDNYILHSRKVLRHLGENSEKFGVLSSFGWRLLYDGSSLSRAGVSGCGGKPPHVIHLGTG
jgi:hypothetical protein